MTVMYGLKTLRLHSPSYSPIVTHSYKYVTNYHGGATRPLTILDAMFLIKYPPVGPNPKLYPLQIGDIDVFDVSVLYPELYSHD